MKSRRTRWMIAALVCAWSYLAGSALADEWKTMTCPSASVAAIGTATNRLELGFLNGHATNDVCVSTRTNMTCNGTAGTDGFHWKAGGGFWLTETSVSAPASKIHYCRAATSDVTASYVELTK